MSHLPLSFMNRVNKTGSAIFKLYICQLIRFARASSNVSKLSEQSPNYQAP